MKVHRATVIKNYWEKLECEAPPPKAVRQVDEIDFTQLRELLQSGSDAEINAIIASLYSGVAYIVKGAAPKSLKARILDLAESFESREDSSFYKMLDGCPNFHRIIDENITQKYSLYAIKHSYYLYNWNVSSSVERAFKRDVYRHWRYIKLLAGNSKFAYEKNIPSDGQVDRLQIVNYPRGGGQLRDHEDPRKNQRIVSGLIMSKLGEDFCSGGFYFVDSMGARLNIEERLDIGDSVMFYGSLIHGVEPVDPQEPLDWGSRRGRWFIGMFVNDSDHVSNRITARDLSGSTQMVRQNLGG